MASRIVIVGSGHSAGQLVATLKQRKFGGTITLIGDETSLPYQRPPLSKSFLAGRLDAERLLVRPESLYQDAAITVRQGLRITSIDRGTKTVIAGNGETFAYDKLVLAVGARPRRLHVPGIELDGIHYLRSIDDVERIRPEMLGGRRLAIVGAGYIGLEVASVAADMIPEVKVLESESRVMSRVVSPLVSAVYESEHRARGVDIQLDARVAAFAGRERLEAVVLEDGQRIAADLAIVGIGAVPNVELAQAADLEVADGIVVDDHCVTSDPDIYAVGDCTCHPNALLGRHLRLESVHNALEQAKTAATNLSGGDAVYADVPWFWSDQYDMKLQIAGLSEGYDQTVVRGDPAERAFAFLYLRDGKLIAIEAINRPKDFMQARLLIAAGNVIDARRAGDASIPLNDLAI